MSAVDDLIRAARAASKASGPQLKLPVLKPPSLPDLSKMLNPYQGEEPDVYDVAELVEEEPGALQRGLAHFDYMGAVLRNAIAGKGTPKAGTFEGRATGRDVLRSLFGSFPENKYVGLESWKRAIPGLSEQWDPKDLAGDFVSFLTEVVTDPLTYVGLGPLTQAGKAAKIGGSLERGILKQMKAGQRSALGLANPLDIFKGKMPMFQEMHALDDMGLAVTPAFTKAVDPVANTIGAGIKKFSDSDLGRKTFHRAGKPADVHLREIQKELNRNMLDGTDILGATSKVNLDNLNDTTGHMTKIIGQDPATGATIELVADLAEMEKKLGLSPDMIDKEFINAMELNMGPLAPKAVVKRSANLLASYYNAMKQMGIRVEPLFDSSLATSQNLGKKTQLGYVPRTSHLRGEGNLFKAKTESLAGMRPDRISNILSRSDIERGIVGGRNTVRDIFTDLELHDIARAHPKDRGKAIKEMAEYIEGRWGDQMDEFLPVRSKAGGPKRVGKISFHGDNGLPYHLSDDQLRRFTTQPTDAGKILDDGSVQYFDKKRKETVLLKRDRGNIVFEGSDGRRYKFTEADAATLKRDAQDNLVLTDDTGAVVMKDGQPVTLTKKGFTAERRARKLAELVFDNESAWTHGPYMNSALADIHSYAQGASNMLATHDAIYRAIGHSISASDDAVRGMTVKDILSQMGVDKTVAAEQIAKRMGLVTDGKELLLKRITPELADDLKLIAPITEKGTHNTFWSGIRGFNTLWKANVLSWPARYMRDFYSGVVRNYEAGFFSSPFEGYRNLRDAHKILMGQTVEGLSDIPVVKEQMARMGWADTPENATRAMQVLFSRKLGGGLSIRQASFKGFDKDMWDAAKSYEELTSMVRGSRTPKTAMDSLAAVPGQVSKTMKEEKFSENFTKLFSVPSESGGLTGASYKISEQVGDYVDTLTRLQAFTAQVRRGVDPDLAMKNLQSALVNYDPRRLSKVERDYARLMIPFYTFARWNIPWVAGRVITRPGGPTGQLLRLYNPKNTEGDPTVPDWMKESLAVPISQNPESGNRYFATGFGLMTEDALGTMSGAFESMLSPGKGARVLGLEGLSRTTPVVKTPIEYFTGVSTFQTSNDGGRPLTEQDPPIGRLLTNLGMLRYPRERYMPGQEMLEHAIGSIPTPLPAPFASPSRLLTLAKKATDSRQTPGGRAGHSLLHALTGIRSTTVDQATAARNLKKKLQEMILESPAGYPFQTVLIDKDRAEYLTEEERAELEELDKLYRAAGEIARLTRAKDESD